MFVGTIGWGGRLPDVVPAATACRSCSEKEARSAGRDARSQRSSDDGTEAGHEVLLKRDPVSGLVVTKIVDRLSGSLIREFPLEPLGRIASNVWQLKPVKVDEVA
jgi:hypothetical protein